MPDPVVGAVRAELSAARAAARAGHEKALARLEAARTEEERVRDAAAQIPARAAEVRERRLSTVDIRHAGAVAKLAEPAREAAARLAPGAAGDPWEGWRPTPLRAGARPGPVRVGTVSDGVPALVRFLDRSHLRIAGSDRGAGDALVAGLLLRTVGVAPPGTVRLTCYDPEHLGSGLAGFAPLATAGLLDFVGPGGLGRLLDSLVEEIRRINETVLAGEHSTLRALAEATGRRPEPWRVVALLGGAHHDELSRTEQAQLARVLRTGVACGVQLIVCDLPVPDPSTVETVSTDRYRSLPLTVEAPPAPLVTSVCRSIADKVAAGPDPAAFEDLMPARLWTESSAAGLTAPIGEGPGGLVPLTLADYPPHALIGGPSGTGKTNLIYAWMGSLAARYSPGELEFYLLDFKEGVSFARFAPGRRDPSWLPHVRLVGIHVNTDREFGMALLRFLLDELRRRAAAAKRHEATTLAELRAEDPTGHWPRIVAVIDEFQVLLAGRDPVAQEAATLLEDLARRGRSQGIHLVLASQDVSGIEALWGRSALVGQFTLRIALPKARRILAEANPAAETVPRYHAVVNADSGAPSANQIVRVPAASDRAAWSALQNRLWRQRPGGLTPPRLFDGEAVPPFPDIATPSAGTPDGPASGPWAGAPYREPVALLGETIDVAGTPARMRLTRAPGRNLAVIGTSRAEACAVLAAAGRSLAAQFPGDAARFSVVCLDADAVVEARRLHAALPAGSGWYDQEGAAELFAQAAADRSGTLHFIIGYAIDAATGRRPSKMDALHTILHSGPERHTHLLGWWRTVARLREDIGGASAQADALGAWVALDVHGGELAPLYPHPGGPAWYPRPWRALYFDRSVHRTAQTIIPYGQSR